MKTFYKYEKISKYDIWAFYLERGVKPCNIVCHITPELNMTESICNSFKSLAIWITTAALQLGIPNSMSTEYAEVKSSKHSQWITRACFC